MNQSFPNEALLDLTKSKYGSMMDQRKIGTTVKYHSRKPTIPFANTSRHKPRRWPLAFRFIKGAIHGAIILPVFIHACFAAIIVFIDRHLDGHLGLPPSIIPSLSIVVGLMLVFRNQTSYNRFWDGRNYLTTIITSTRNLTRMFLTCSFSEKDESATRITDRAETERAVKALVAILYATKNHLRADWGAFPGIALRSYSANGAPILNPEYSDLLPPSLIAYDHKGLGIPLQLTFFVEQYIKKGFRRGWFHAPQASQMTVQMNALVDAYGKMETIRLTPIPVAHLIHQKQVLGLFGVVLPFAMVDGMGWWAVPLTTFVVFTLYGIDGIGAQLEDPFGCDRNDINMDGIVEDIRAETLVLVDEWKRVREDDLGEVEWFAGKKGWRGGGFEGEVVPSINVVECA